MKPNERKLSVFISSTYEDMKAERAVLVEAILKAGHFPTGMELFSVGDHKQWETIQQWITASDLVIVMVGPRYGSKEPVSRKSYVECEYDYAINIGKPVIRIVLNDAFVNKKIKKMGTDAVDDPGSAALFRKRLMGDKMCTIVSDLKDISFSTFKILPHFPKNIPIWAGFAAITFHSPPKIYLRLDLQALTRCRRYFARSESPEQSLGFSIFSTSRKIASYWLLKTTIGMRALA